MNVKNTKIPVLEPLQMVGNFINVRVENEIYRSTDSYFQNINSSNVNVSLYASLVFIGNIQLKLVIRGVTSINNFNDKQVQVHTNYITVEIYDMYNENNDAVNSFIIRSVFVREITYENITISNNDISNTDPIGIFYIATFNGGRVNLKNVTIKNSDIWVMPVFDYRQIGTGSLIAEDFYVQNVILRNESKIIKAQSLKCFRVKNNVFLRYNLGN